MISLTNGHWISSKYIVSVKIEPPSKEECRFVDSVWVQVTYQGGYTSAMFDNFEQAKVVADAVVMSATKAQTT